ncbi:hypothetical protein C8F04DRAFT_1193198 [Mycena alexandri]|uniref:Uncharacterized protein n=1 Tax=Mycena alexandri TaxID=1745969 RepID=A0AAD6SB25_9AGAR|nr:hypothetical protein C8F04DRAFT_1193198 [Mycena alexandri]
MAKSTPGEWCWDESDPVNIQGLDWRVKKGRYRWEAAEKVNKCQTRARGRRRRVQDRQQLFSGVVHRSNVDVSRSWISVCGNSSVKATRWVSAVPAKEMWYQRVSIEKGMVHTKDGNTISLQSPRKGLGREQSSFAREMAAGCGIVEGRGGCPPLQGNPTQLRCDRGRRMNSRRREMRRPRGVLNGTIHLALLARARPWRDNEKENRNAGGTKKQQR